MTKQDFTSIFILYFQLKIFKVSNIHSCSHFFMYLESMFELHTFGNIVMLKLCDIYRSGMIEQLLSLQLISYMKSEMEYVPWTSATSNIAYIRRMLENSGVYGSFQVSHIITYYICIFPFDVSPGNKIHTSFFHTNIIISVYISCTGPLWPVKLNLCITR